jgi:hypothetical protein
MMRIEQSLMLIIPRIEKQLGTRPHVVHLIRKPLSILGL